MVELEVKRYSMCPIFRAFIRFFIGPHSEGFHHNKVERLFYRVSNHIHTVARYRGDAPSQNMLWKLRRATPHAVPFDHKFVLVTCDHGLTPVSIAGSFPIPGPLPLHLTWVTGQQA